MNSAEVKEMKEIQILSKKNGQIICKAVLQLLELFPYIEDHKDGLQTTPETTIAIEYYKPMI